MALDLPNAFRKSIAKQPDPVDPNGEDEEEQGDEPTAGKPNPLKRWAEAKLATDPAPKR